VVGAGGAGVVLVGVVWFCILIVPGTRVVTGMGWDCTVTGAVAFFCSEKFCCDVFVIGGSWVVHPAISMRIPSVVNKIKIIFCINPAERKRAIKVLFSFEMEKKFR
jgi:hypothetical protein